ncbi:transcriptional regulator [Sphingomonas panaciterrae]|uniref:transcriptional regulator n=1 Tax=Sphingomonas panaciterrae TaxID=1462999 RepID=UPI002FF2B376
MKTHPFHGALRDALARAGDNQTVFAKGIGTSQQLVSYWLRNGCPLPAEFVIPAENAGFGSRHEIRPDLYPAAEAAA